MNIHQKRRFLNCYAYTIIQSLSYWTIIKTVAMGNRFRESSLFNKTAMSQIGTISICPNCQESFPPTTTFQNFDQHVTDCLQNFRPSDQERKRMQRRKKSKDSNGSSENGQRQQQLDETTVQVYIKKTDYTGQQSNKQEVKIVKKTQDSILDKNKNIKFVPKKSYWVKSKLTFYQSILYSMSFADISKQGPPYKILWFHNKLESMKVSWKFGPEQLTFHPDNIVEHSLKIVHMDMYKQLKLTVLNDVVHDAGGLLRQWIGMLLKELIEKYNLFVRNSSGFYTLNPQLSTSDKLNQKVKVTTQQKISLSDQFDIVKQYYFKSLGQNNQTQDPYIFNSLQNQVYSQQKNQLPLKNSAITYKDLYELFAVILAKAIIEKVTIVPSFDRIFLYQLISREYFTDEKYLDNLYTYDKAACQALFYLERLEKNLKNQLMYNESLQQLRSLYLTFSIRLQQESIDYELVPSGSQILIQKQDQLREYIRKYKQYYLHQKHKNQQLVIRKKFLSILKPQIFEGLFSCEEFELLINGVDGNNIDIKDWQEGTAYKQPFHPNHKIIKYFWNAVTKMTPYHRMRLFKFVTGAERLPVYGFKNLQTNRGQTSCFTIQSIKYDKKVSQFPKAHTCFNRLVLPLYPNEESLVNGLNAVVNSQFDGVWGMQ